MQTLRKTRFIIAIIAALIALTLGVSFGEKGTSLKLDKSSVSALEKTSQLTDISTLNRVLLKVSDAYVDPNRIDPNRMLAYALQAVEQKIPEVVISFDRDIDLNPTTADVSVKSVKKRFKIADVRTTWEASYKLKSILDFISNYVVVDKKTQNQLQEAEINGMLSTLDPHTVYLPPKNFDEIRTQTGGKFGGVGIEITPRDGRLLVVSALVDTPAERAGIKAQDVIVQINDQSTLNMTIDDAVELLRGEPGTTVDLYITRENSPTPKKFTIPRAIIKLKSLISKALPNKIAYLRITNFQANTYDDFVEHYSQLLKDMNGIDGMILDLRDNPGGLLDQAVKIANLFLSKGPLVSTVGVNNKTLAVEMARKKPTLPNFPVAILLNAGTASASEILAGALKNHKRAITIGDTSFGKGSVQVLHEFADHSALKLTIAQYLTPGKISIQGFGISPDIHTQSVEVDNDFIDLFPPKKVLRESTLSSHLTNSATTSRDKTRYDLQYLSKPLPPDSNDPLDDFNIQLAYKLIEATERRKRLVVPLNQAQDDVFQAVLAEQDRAIRDELKGRDVDWTAGPVKKDAKITATITAEPEGPVLAGESFKLRVVVTNPNDFPLYRVYGRTLSSDPLLDDLEFIFGKVEPHGTRYWVVDLPVDAAAQSRTSDVGVEFWSADTPLDGTTNVQKVVVKAAPRPDFALTTSIADDSGDGYLSPGESAKLVVRLRNLGDGQSKKTRILLRSEAASHVFLKSGRETAFTLKPNETKTFNFDFELNHDDTSDLDETALKIEIFDQASQRFSSHTIKIPIREASPVQELRAGNVEVTTPTPLYPTAFADGAPLTTIPAGTRLRRLGVVDGFSRVALTSSSDPTLTGFLSNDALTDAPDTSDTYELTHDTYKNADITLHPSQEYTSGKRIEVTADVSSDTDLRDYIAVVVYQRGPSTRREKILYGEFSKDTKKGKITFPVELHRGMNLIEFLVRDKKDITAGEQSIVFRAD